MSGRKRLRDPCLRRDRPAARRWRTEPVAIEKYSVPAGTRPAARPWRPRRLIVRSSTDADPGRGRRAAAHRARGERPDGHARAPG
ncbi:MAG: hypothetical protein MZV64_28430 [Ignavibacteriales bacterium]|nr:hypothetical protein [Ignavibacteriales bacterium]